MVRAVAWRYCAPLAATACNVLWYVAVVWGMPLSRWARTTVEAIAAAIPPM